VLFRSEEAAGQKFVPNDERSDFLWPEFLLPFPPPPELGDQTPPTVVFVFTHMGGVEIKTRPYFAIFVPFLKKNDQYGALAYIGEAPLGY
jgi:hypothetical protein